MTDLFEAAGLSGAAQDAPLADRLRPQSLDEVVGQDHLLGPEGPIRRMAEAKRDSRTCARLPSCSRMVMVLRTSAFSTRSSTR